jgi:hypothetical protein
MFPIAAVHDALTHCQYRVGLAFRSCVSSHQALSSSLAEDELIGCWR